MIIHFTLSLKNMKDEQRSDYTIHECLINLRIGFTGTYTLSFVVLSLYKEYRYMFAYQSSWPWPILLVSSKDSDFSLAYDEVDPDGSDWESV